jgi:hypothetical protein
MKICKCEILISEIIYNSSGCITQRPLVKEGINGIKDCSMTVQMEGAVCK